LVPLRGTLIWSEMDDPRKILFHEWLLDACTLLVRLLELIPPDRPEERREAANLILQKVADEIERVLNDPTQH
jgi:hypothetical protein